MRNHSVFVSCKLLADDDLTSISYLISPVLGRGAHGGWGHAWMHPCRILRLPRERFGSANHVHSNKRKILDLPSMEQTGDNGSDGCSYWLPNCGCDRFTYMFKKWDVNIEGCVDGVTLYYQKDLVKRSGSWIIIAFGGNYQDWISLLALDSCRQLEYTSLKKEKKIHWYVAQSFRASTRELPSIPVLATSCILL